MIPYLDLLEYMPFYLLSFSPGCMFAFLHGQTEVVWFSWTAPIVNL
jgi:hypothetical protein